MMTTISKKRFSVTTWTMDLKTQWTKKITMKNSMLTTGIVQVKTHL
jgi:hypothetical protein